MPIKKAVIKNIESHENTTLHFDNGVNAIIGSSESGKSVFQRLLEAFLYFKGMTLRFDSPWGGFEIHTDRGVLTRYRQDKIKYKCKSCKKASVKRKKFCKCGCEEFVIDRTKEYDIYSIYGVDIDTIRSIIEDPDNSIEEDPRTSKCCFEKMSRGFNNLSKEIVDSLPFPLLDVRKGNPLAIGIKQQFDQFIWDELSAAELSRLFSYLEGYDYVNDMVEYIKKDVKNDKAIVKVLGPDLEELELKTSDAKELSVKAKSEYDEALTKKDKFAEIYGSYEKLGDLVGRYEQVVKRGKKINQSLQDLNFKPYKKVERLLVEYRQIAKVFDLHQKIYANVIALEERIEAINVAPIDRLRSLLEEARELRYIVQRIDLKQQQIQASELVIESLTEEIENNKEEFNRIIIENGVCPYSGFKLQKACKKLILENFSES